jgi:hypothetical protein
MLIEPPVGFPSTQTGFAFDEIEDGAALVSLMVVPDQISEID